MQANTLLTEPPRQRQDHILIISPRVPIGSDYLGSTWISPFVLDPLVSPLEV